MADQADQRRRWVIKSLLRADGLNLADYRQRFGTDAEENPPELATLQALGLARRDGGTLQPTPAGLGQSDAVGPWLYSERARERMGEYEWR